MSGETRNCAIGLNVVLQQEIHVKNRKLSKWIKKRGAPALKIIFFLVNCSHYIQGKQSSHPMSSGMFTCFDLYYKRFCTEEGRTGWRPDDLRLARPIEWPERTGGVRSSNNEANRVTTLENADHNDLFLPFPTLHIKESRDWKRWTS